MRWFASQPAIPAEYLAVYRGNGMHGDRLGRKRLSQSAGTLSVTLQPEEQIEYITPAGFGVVAVTDARIIQIARGRIAAAFARAAVRRSMVRLEGQVPSVELSGADGRLGEPVEFFELGEALAFSAVISEADGARTGFAGPPLLAPELISQLDRIGVEAYGPPYEGAQPRLVQPSGPTILLDAAAAMGVPYPAPGTPDWSEYETRLCTDLLDAVAAGGEWAIAGALYIARELDHDSRNPAFREIVESAGAFLRRHDVPRALWPWFMDP